MRLFLPILFVALTSCVGIQSALGHPPCESNSSTSPVPEATLQQAWKTKYPKLWSDDCATSGWSWLVEPEDVFYKSCPGTNGCTIYGMGPNGSSMPGCPLSMTYPKYAQSKELATHEYAHWMLRCATHDGDINHTNHPEVWGTGGFDGMFGP